MSEKLRAAETKIVLAALAGDYVTVDIILGGFLRHELAELIQACSFVHEHATHALAKMPAPRRTR